jgi:tetratricopeptide (TPR) repeat protein
MSAYPPTADIRWPMSVIVHDFTEVIRLDPENAAAYNNRCWIYDLMRRLDDALSDCNESLRLQPDDALTLDSRAFAYWLLKEHDKAQKDLEQARRIDPSVATWQERFREFERIF